MINLTVVRQRIHQAIRYFRQQLPGARPFFRLELLPALVFAAVLTLPAFYRQPQAFSYAHSLWLLIGLGMVIAVGVALIFRFVLPSPATRLAASLVAIYCFTQDYDRRDAAGASNLLSVFLPDKHTLVMILIILGGSWAVGWGIGRLARRHTEWEQRLIPGMVLGVVAVSALYNTGQFVAYSLQHAKAFTFLPHAALSQVKATATAPVRDIYYIVLDRYAGAETLERDYQFNNTAFLDQLRSDGFIVRANAYSNYQFTAPSLASTLNMVYLNELQTNLGSEATVSYLPYRRMIEDNAVQHIVKDAGYNVYNLSSWFGVTRVMNEASNINPRYQMTLFGRSFLLGDLQDVMLSQTVFGALFKGGLRIGPVEIGQINSDMTTRELLESQFDKLHNLATTPHDKPQFVFAHIISPHPPYLFLPDGSAANYGENDDDAGAPLKLKYTNQIQYLNGQISQLVNTIQSASKQPPIIVIQADEGPYPPEFLAATSGSTSGGETSGNYQWESAATSTLQHKTNILSAFALPGITDEARAELTTPANTFRVIFNHYFGTNLPYLPDCTFFFNDTKPFNFLDASALVRGQADAECRKYAGGSLKTN